MLSTPLVRPLDATVATTFIPDNYSIKVIFNCLEFVLDFCTCGSVVKKREVTGS